MSDMPTKKSIASTYIVGHKKGPGLNVLGQEKIGLLTDKKLSAKQ